MTTLIAGGHELEQTVATADDIVRHIERQAKRPEDFMIGMEYERLGVHKENGEAITFDEIETILDRVAERDGWTRGIEDERIIYLAKQETGEMITLEPGGQTEYSSAPAKTIAELMATAAPTIRMIDRIADELGIAYLGIGYHPFASSESIGWVPKRRYKVMAPYLEKHGKLAHKMMKMTAGVQISLDFSSGADAMRKLRAALLCTPIAQAIFASSGIARGVEIPFVDWRARIWTETDNERCNIPDFMVKPGASLEEYVEWLLDMPLMFWEHEGNYEESNGRTLRSMMKQGRVRVYDVEMTMTQAFPEARLKRFVEVRSLDTVQPKLLGTAPCFWSSLLYGDLDAIFGLLGEMTGDKMSAMRHAVFTQGLRGHACGRPIADWARDLLAIAKDTATCRENMTILWERVERRETPADEARRVLAGAQTRREFVERSGWPL